MALAPVFNSDGVPLFKDSGGGVLVPAIAEDPCDCCGISGDCCVQLSDELTAYVTISGVVSPVDNRPGGLPVWFRPGGCACPQWNTTFAVPMTTTGIDGSGNYHFCSGSECFEDFLDWGCDINAVDSPDMLVQVTLTNGSPAATGRLACLVKAVAFCGFGCAYGGEGVDTDVGPNPTLCEGLTASGSLTMYGQTYQCDTGDFRSIHPSCNITRDSLGAYSVAPASFSVSFS